jgi:hypothetical protein
MKIQKHFRLTVIALVLFSNCLIINAQDTINRVDPQIKTFIVTKNDGTEYIGHIITQDEREVLIDTKEIGRLFIPKHEIKSIVELTSSDVISGATPENYIFGSRYFLTTNGLRMRKGESYALFNYWGPEIQYSVSDKLTLGAMTTWVAMPIVLSAKTSFSANENLHFGLGLLAGTLSWASWKTVGALPYGTVTLGNSINNINFTAGYAMITGNPGSDNLNSTDEDISGSAPLLSVGCLLKITKKISFVGDSFIYAKEGSFAIIVPGIRVSNKPNRAFQMGFAAVYAEGEMIPMPIPMVSWFIRI